MLFFFFFQDNEQNGGKKERSYFIPPRWQRPYNLWFIHSPGGNSSIFLPTCMTVPGGHCLPTSVHPVEKRKKKKQKWKGKGGKDTTYLSLSPFLSLIRTLRSLCSDGQSKKKPFTSRMILMMPPWLPSLGNFALENGENNKRLVFIELPSSMPVSKLFDTYLRQPVKQPLLKKDHTCSKISGR